MGGSCSKKKMLPLSDSLDSLDSENEDSEKKAGKPKQKDPSSVQSATPKSSPKSTKNKAGEKASSDKACKSPKSTAASPSSAQSSSKGNNAKSKTAESSKSKSMAGSSGKTPPVRIPTKPTTTNAELKRTPASSVPKGPPPSCSPFQPENKDPPPAEIPNEPHKKADQQTQMSSQVDSQVLEFSQQSTSLPPSEEMNNSPSPTGAVWPVPSAPPFKPSEATPTMEPQTTYGSTGAPQQQQSMPFPPTNYQERPRVLQLENGMMLNLPKAEDYNRQLNDEKLQAHIRAYFEELMHQMKTTPRMVQSGNDGTVQNQVAQGQPVAGQFATAPPALGQYSPGQYGVDQSESGQHASGQEPYQTPYEKYQQQQQQKTQFQPSQPFPGAGFSPEAIPPSQTMQSQPPSEPMHPHQQVMPTQQMQPVPYQQMGVSQAVPSQPASGLYGQFPGNQPTQATSPYYSPGPQQQLQQHSGQQFQQPMYQQKMATPTYQAAGPRQQQPPQMMPQLGTPIYQQTPYQQQQQVASIPQSAPRQAASQMFAHPSGTNTSSMMFQQQSSRPQMTVPSRSVQHMPSHNSMGNPSLIHAQATDSQLFPSMQPAGASPFRGPTPAQAAYQRPQVMKQYQPPPTLLNQPRPMIFQPPPMPPMGFPTFPPTIPRNRAPPPPPNQMQVFPPPPPSPMAVPATPGPNPQWPAMSGPAAPGAAPMSFPTTTPMPPVRSQKHHHDYTHEQMDTIHREIQELKTLVQGQELTDLVAKMEQMVNDLKKLKSAYGNIVRELKKDDRFRAEKNRADSEIRAVYSKVKNDFKDLTSSVDLISKSTKQMVNSMKRDKASPKVQGAKPVVVVKQQDLQKLNDQMDRLMNGLTQLKSVYGKAQGKAQGGPSGASKNA